MTTEQNQQTEQDAADHQELLEGIQLNIDNADQPIERAHWKTQLTLAKIQANPKTNQGIYSLNELVENSGLTGSSEVGYNLTMFGNSINFLQTICHGAAVKSGWWTDLETGEYKFSTYPAVHPKVSVGNLTTLMISEICEGFEAHRKDAAKDDHLEDLYGLEVELADAVIRIFDFAGGLGLDVGGAIIAKLAYNQQRSDHKLANRQAEGGKKV